MCLLTDGQGPGRAVALAVAHPLQLAQPRGDAQEALDHGPEAEVEPRHQALQRLHHDSENAQAPRPTSFCE